MIGRSNISPAFWTRTRQVYPVGFQEDLCQIVKAWAHCFGFSRSPRAARFYQRT